MNLPHVLIGLAIPRHELSGEPLKTYPSDIPAWRRFPLDWQPRDNAYACLEVVVAWGGTVLLVEDEPMVRKLGQSALTRLGFAVLLAKDGVEALEVLRQHKDEVRCVVCDVTMPRMDGWETLAALRMLAPGLPVVLASGYDETQVMAGNHPELPEAFLSKPYHLQDLGDAIRRALAGKK